MPLQVIYNFCSGSGMSHPSTLGGGGRYSGACRLASARLVKGKCQIAARQNKNFEMSTRCKQQVHFATRGHWFSCSAPCCEGSPVKPARSNATAMPTDGRGTREASAPIVTSQRAHSWKYSSVENTVGKLERAKQFQWNHHWKRLETQNGQMTQTQREGMTEGGGGQAKVAGGASANSRARTDA